ncbi:MULTISPECIES: cache domain-containing protein [unclassified Undibacterium]|uniref:cache domain-containing protein n=1 Tax=unclassified Undibacterium TaxID=2630295 RepID=UPI002AC8B235|nr:MULTISPECIES: cache domain-containing protein [unclassified Undibacterium]MEB0140802.1 cache domain-containing protein [Undibacterium sp. CCC2.1]MEB0174235.1 cache domain-containing protein [Undibacterium sp. CCC1.1]MEB0178178.1 cache domain-containing protein [Undibacterium sp. CCC3.4]MEB0217381.1 cache domain-containing protein [Undibacterium sp. 5I2]WPX45229.1 cache domain-containing protein [Undibacterium sp. CCC3.4]
MKRYAILGITCLLLTPTLPVFAQTANKFDAIALVDKAVADIEKKGVDEACKEFADPKSGNIQGDLYVFVLDSKMTMVCDAFTPKMNGKDMSLLKDANGKKFVQEMRDMVQSRRSGWVDYVWTNPATKMLEGKTSYVRLASNKYTVGAGIYKTK